MNNEDDYPNGINGEVTFNKCPSSSVKPPLRPSIKKSVCGKKVENEPVYGMEDRNKSNFIKRPKKPKHLSYGQSEESMMNPVNIGKNCIDSTINNSNPQICPMIGEEIKHLLSREPNNNAQTKKIQKAAKRACGLSKIDESLLSNAGRDKNLSSNPIKLNKEFWNPSGTEIMKKIKPISRITIRANE